MKVESVGKRMTTIGTQLRKFRMLLGLSQTEMAAGIVTESFYSKVERDKSAITIDKLVAILNKHEIYMTSSMYLIRKIYLSLYYVGTCMKRSIIEM